MVTEAVRRADVGDEDERPVRGVPGRVVAVAGPAPLAELTALVEAAPEEAGLPAGEPFSLFLAMDYRAVDESDPQAVALSALLERCLTRGVFAASTWGPRCEVVHDLVDWEDIDTHLDDPDPNWPVVLTSWHSEDTIEEALRFFMSLQVPDEGKPGGRLSLILMDEAVDSAPVLAWLDHWQIPAHRLPTRGPTTD